jgi:hypothetical protein
MKNKIILIIKYIFFFLLFLWLIFILNNIGIITNELKRSLLIETYGSGILALIIAIALDFLEKQTENRLKKESLAKWKVYELVENLKMLFRRKPSAWNPKYGNYRFYFDGCYCNPVYDDICMKYRRKINEYMEFYPGDEIMKILSEFSIIMREGAILSEKFEEKIISIARKEHYKRGVHSANDYDLVYYLKAKIYSYLEDKIILMAIDKNKFPERYELILKKVSEDEEVKDIKEKLVKKRQLGILKIEELEEIIR